MRFAPGRNVHRSHIVDTCRSIDWSRLLPGVLIKFLPSDALSNARFAAQVGKIADLEHRHESLVRWRAAYDLDIKWKQIVIAVRDKSSIAEVPQVRPDLYVFIIYQWCTSEFIFSKRKGERKGEKGRKRVRMRENTRTREREREREKIGWACLFSFEQKEEGVTRITRERKNLSSTFSRRSAASRPGTPWTVSPLHHHPSTSRPPAPPLVEGTREFASTQVDTAHRTIWMCLRFRFLVSK